MGYQVDIKRQGISALIEIQGQASRVSEWLGDDLPAMPGRPNSFTRYNHCTLCWVGPERWLLRADLKMEQKLIEQTRLADAPMDLSLVLVSDTQYFYSITGEDADAVVATGCPLDIHPDQFKQDSISQTEIFGVRGLLLRCEGGFELATESSFADMIEDYLQRATATN